MYISFFISFILAIERRLNETCDDDIQCSVVTPNSTCNRTTNVCECTEGHLQMLNMCVHGNTGDIFFHVFLILSLTITWNEHLILGAISLWIVMSARKNITCKIFDHHIGGIFFSLFNNLKKNTFKMWKSRARYSLFLNLI